MKTARHAALCLALALCVTSTRAQAKKVEQIKSVDGALFDKSTRLPS